MMTRKQLSLIGAFAACFMLAGCGHEHTWAEASCTEPKTCSECGEIEGEALGHTWAEATCTEAKICRVCGETEGEPLGHTLTEANYQQPAACEVCGETEGEPLQAEFEKFGLTCSAEQGTEYPIVASIGETEGIPITMTVGNVTFSDYEVFDSDDTHEGLEGYEWRAITVETQCDGNGNYYYANTESGYIAFPLVVDYYCDFESTYNESTDAYTLNYNGKDYADVKFDGEIIQNEWNDDNIWIARIRYFYRVPKGYDGLVATIVDGSQMPDSDILYDIGKLINDNAFFRLK